MSFTEMMTTTVSSASASARFIRSYSVCSDSSMSTTSSLSSKKAEDMLDRLVNQAVGHTYTQPKCIPVLIGQQPTSTIHLWSAGNVRLGRMDLTIASHDAMDLIEALKVDDRVGFNTTMHA